MISLCISTSVCDLKVGESFPLCNYNLQTSSLKFSALYLPLHFLCYFQSKLVPFSCVVPQDFSVHPHSYCILYSLLLFNIVVFFPRAISRLTTVFLAFLSISAIFTFPLFCLEIRLSCNIASLDCRPGDFYAGSSGFAIV